MTTVNKCPQCGASIDYGVTSCEYCGSRFVPTYQQTPQQPYQQPYQQPPQPPLQPPYQQPYQQQPHQNVSANHQYSMTENSVYDSAWPVKSKITAGVLAMFLGGLGIHKFYLGQTGLGVIYILLCWTYVPAIVGFIEGIIYLCSNDHNFQIKNKVRLK